MDIHKYKPKKHTNPENCNDNCEMDCNMECMICRATPWDTKLYYIVQGENSNIQLCEKCLEELKNALQILREKSKRR